VTLKTDIERLMAKGLSGREAGRLAVQELVELDHGGQGVLSEKDIRALTAALRTPEEGADYQRMVALYEALPLMLSEAQVVSQQTERVLADLQRELERYWVSARVANLARGCELALWLACDGDSAEEAEPGDASPASWLAQLSDVMGVHWLAENYAKSHGQPFSDLLDLMHRAAGMSAAVLLAYLEVIAQASAVLGIAAPTCWPQEPRELDIFLPQGDSEDLLGDVRGAAAFYNEVAKATAAWQDAGCPALPPLELDELAPDESTVNVLHIRVAHGLGRTGLVDDWWKGKP
jgi:hypothetical protein